MLFASALLALAWTASTPAVDEHSKKVDALFSDWDSTETPGAVVAVIENGKILYQSAFGMAVLERNVPLSPKSIFDIASISKQFTAPPNLAEAEDDLPEPPTLPKDVARDLDDFSGHYYGVELDATYAIRSEGGNLVLRIGLSSTETRLAPIDRDVFAAKRTSLTFLRDDADTINGFDLRSGRVKDIYFEKVP